MTDLGVVIVSWNVRDLLLNALRTLLQDVEQTTLEVRVVVVDNASADGSVQAICEQFPQVQVIASDENLGFGRGNNTGLRVLGFGSDVSPSADLPHAVYLLNSDTITEPGATEILYRTLLSDRHYGVTGARLSFGDGSFQHAGFAFPGLQQLWAEFFPIPGRLIEGRFNGRYSTAHYTSESPFEVDFVLGATMMLRKEVILQTGMFDEQFFMYCEEIDWQWRIRNAGWRILCVPTAHVIHLGGQSTSQVKPRSIINLWESRLRLFDKHYPRWKKVVARRMIVIGMNRKIRQAQRQGVSPEVIEAYQTVKTMAQS